MNCILLGSKSDIALAIKPMLEVDGYTVFPWFRDQELPDVRWDLVVCCLGQVSPVGLWKDIGPDKFEQCIKSNVLLPARLLRKLWDRRNPNAQVCFFAGSNPNKIMDGYCAYNVGKMALLKFVEQLDHESPDTKVFALGPGVTSTKIHSATILANWPNSRLTRALNDGSFTSMEDIYKTLQWGLRQPKEVIGGRNICVSDLNGLYGDGHLELALRRYEDLFKLRRDEYMGAGPLG